jgi:hypothetical protein
MAFKITANGKSTTVDVPAVGLNCVAHRACEAGQ